MKPWPKVGTILEIPVKDYHIYGRIASDIMIAFYDSKGLSILDDFSNLPECEVLFTCVVEDRPVKDGSWKRVGWLSPEKHPISVLAQFIQDRFNPRNIIIVSPDGTEYRSASYSEAVGLESAAIWGKWHIESRIDDHYSGRDNVFVKSLQLVKV